MKCSRTSWKQPPIIAWKINGRRAKKRRRGGGRKEAFYWSICESWWQYQISVHALRHDRPGGWFSKSWGLSASISFLSSPSPPGSFTHPTFVWSLTLIPSSLHGNCTEVLVTQSNWGLSVLGFFCFVLFGSKPSLMSLLGSDDWTEMSCKTHFTRLFWLIVKFSLGLDWSGPTVLAGPSCSKDGYYHPQDNSLFSGYVY